MQQWAAAHICSSIEQIRHDTPPHSISVAQAHPLPTLPAAINYLAGSQQSCPCVTLLVQLVLQQHMHLRVQIAPSLPVGARLLLRLLDSTQFFSWLRKGLLHLLLAASRHMVVPPHLLMW